METDSPCRFSFLIKFYYFSGRVIYTKWCGPGNDAKHFDDLGENTEIDRCCRSHDHCRLSIAPGETKYNFTNDGLYRISDCLCDNEFRYCLDNTNFWVANLVAGLYAFTNNRCLVNICAYLGYRCSRGVDVELRYIGNEFRGNDQ